MTQELRQLVQEIEVHDWHAWSLLPPHGYENTKEIDYEELWWSAQPRVPAKILQALTTYQPQCDMQVALRKDTVFYGSFYPPLDSVESIRRLRDFKNLVSLGIALPSRQRDHFVELQKAVFDSRKLRSLSIYAIARPLNDWSPTFVTEYLWDRSRREVYCPLLAQLHLYNFCALRTFTCASLVTYLNRRLPGLNSPYLHLESQPVGSCKCSVEFDRKRIKEFLLGCDRLSELRLINCTVAADEQLFAHLGKSFRSLKLHEYEKKNQPDIPFSTKTCLDRGSLKNLGKSCPLLRNLCIDVNHEDEWFLECLELNVAKSIETRRSEPSIESTRELWKYFWERLCISPSIDAPISGKASDTFPALKSLVISSGSSYLLDVTLYRPHCL
ncbi:hypothetical protein AJ79_07096 [Helicocarpus griseus UAMH5409]|uniref:F-box domain-containing protein n=1 Tax=Helicocarpus griseus UAMH5409 TaxID=1447875 RepID=A0A2B7X6B6_9EURO|nr:hypothetical protein AJ79_07096 [Helicocarpus griseus UAMH5409]